MEDPSGGEHAVCPLDQRSPPLRLEDIPQTEQLRRANELLEGSCFGGDQAGMSDAVAITDEDTRVARVTRNGECIPMIDEPEPSRGGVPP